MRILVIRPRRSPTPRHKREQKEGRGRSIGLKIGSRFGHGLKDRRGESCALNRLHMGCPRDSVDPGISPKDYSSQVADVSRFPVAVSRPEAWRLARLPIPTSATGCGVRSGV
jgi:hypothetical protein